MPESDFSMIPTWMVRSAVGLACSAALFLASSTYTTVQELNVTIATQQVKIEELQRQVGFHADGVDQLWTKVLAAEDAKRPRGR